jgi:hypothetical protein
MNITSVANAGKQKYGENHWFWAVWLGVEKQSNHDWDHGWDHQTEPTASGFSCSKSKARSAAWGTLHVGCGNTIIRNWWAMGYLSAQHRAEGPYFSRCRVGKDKWLWVVYRQDEIFGEHDPLAHGFAVSVKDAEKNATRAVGSVSQIGNWLANRFRKKQAAIKRSQKETTTTGTTPLEFVYECHQSCSDYNLTDSDAITKHRIVKRTKKRIYVERESHWQGQHTTGDWMDFVVPTFILDREEFERTGKSRRRGRSCCTYYNTFYADPDIYHAERRSTAYRPECLVGLGVPAGASAKEIQSAYRKLARKTHPDAGGDAEDFKRVNVWYEEAMALAG